MRYASKCARVISLATALVVALFVFVPSASGACAPPTGWVCDANHYDTNDGCQCGCGIYDPDCDLPNQQIMGCGEGQTCGFDSLCYNCSNLEDAMIVGGTVLKITTSENGRCAVECPLGSAGKSCQYPARAPAEWTCDTDNYASADGCHCIYDPDCDTMGAEIIGCGGWETCLSTWSDESSVYTAQCEKCSNANVEEDSTLASLGDLLVSEEGRPLVGPSLGVCAYRCKGYTTGPSCTDPCRWKGCIPGIGALASLCYSRLTISRADAITTIDALQQLADAYVFTDISRNSPEPAFPLKVDIKSRLNSIRLQLVTMDSASIIAADSFHATLAALYQSLQDAHTVYIKPLSYSSSWQMLPLNFLSYADDRTGEQIVTISGTWFNLFPELEGMEVTSWYIVDSEGKGTPTVARNYVARFANETVGVSRDVGTRYNLAINYLYSQRSASMAASPGVTSDYIAVRNLTSQEPLLYVNPTSNRTSPAWPVTWLWYSRKSVNGIAQLVSQQAAISDVTIRRAVFNEMYQQGENELPAVLRERLERDSAHDNLRSAGTIAPFPLTQEQLSVIIIETAKELVKSPGLISSAMFLKREEQSIREGVSSSRTTRAELDQYRRIEEECRELFAGEMQWPSLRKRVEDSECMKALRRFYGVRDNNFADIIDVSESIEPNLDDVSEEYAISSTGDGEEIVTFSVPEMERSSRKDDTSDRQVYLEYLTGSKAIAFYQYNSDTFLIRLASFSPKTNDELTLFYTTLVYGFVRATERNLPNMILDLRGNGGGYICLSFSLLQYILGRDLEPRGIYDFRSSPLLKQMAEAADKMDKAPSMWAADHWINITSKTPFENAEWMTRERLLTRAGVTSGYSQLLRDECEDWYEILPQLKLQHYTPDSILMLTYGYCGSSCAVFSKHLQQHHHVRTVAVGGIQGVPMGYASFPGGQVYAYHKMLSDVEALNISSQMIQFPTSAQFSFTIREVYSWTEGKEDLPLEFDFDAADFHLDYSAESVVDDMALYKDVHKYFDVCRSTDVKLCEIAHGAGKKKCGSGGTFSESLCVAYTCNAGYEINNGICSPCRKGSQKTSEGSERCLPCQAISVNCEYAREAETSSECSVYCDSGDVSPYFYFFTYFLVFAALVIIVMMFLYFRARKENVEIVGDGSLSGDADEE